jgi:hypothetical protein
VKEREIKITIETYEVLAISHPGDLNRNWCASCGKRVVVISINDACMSGLSMEAVERCTQTGQIHLIDTAGGLPAICLNSLIQSERRKENED